MNANGIALGVIGIALAAVSAHLEIHKKGGSFWGIVALLFLMSSCSALGG